MKYKVIPFVHDRALEVILNMGGWDVFELFRNTPGLDGEETTTVVLCQGSNKLKWKRKKCFCESD